MTDRRRVVELSQMRDKMELMLRGAVSAWSLAREPDRRKETPPAHSGNEGGKIQREYHSKVILN